MREYAKWLGMELGDDVDLFWIAKEGLKAPLPENWKPCKTVDTDEIYYFNFATGELTILCSLFKHPCGSFTVVLRETLPTSILSSKRLCEFVSFHDRSHISSRMTRTNKQHGLYGTASTHER